MNPLNQLFPKMNDISPSWADMKFTFALAGGGPITGALPVIDVSDIAAVNTSRTVEVGKKYGLSGGRMTGRSTGQESSEASITFWLDGLVTFKEILMTVAPIRGGQAAISLVHFNITQLWTPPMSTKIFHRKILGCRVLGDTLNSAEGPDIQQVEVPLSVAQIVDVINGREVSLL